MRIWRLSRHASLDGAGGLRVGGRWHTAGAPVVYCAPNPATAVLEQLVHQEIRRAEALQGYRMLEIELPDAVHRHKIEVAQLPAQWANDVQVTRQVGDEWLAAGAAAVLFVPSVLVPVTHNVLINPKHPHAARIRLIDNFSFLFDSRLL